MLVLPIKPAVRYDIFSALAKWMDSDHHISFEPRNPLQFILPKPDFTSVAVRSELLRLQGLRNSLADTLLKPMSHKSALEEGAMEDLHEYHAVLLEFEKRGFPTLDDEMTGIQLTWKGAWATSRQEKHATLIWDRANTIFNIVALLTSRAADARLSDRDSCKQAVGECQTAASLLAILKQLVLSEDFKAVEFSTAHLDFWQKLLLAEAQNFIYRMAAAAGAAANHGTLSILAQSAYELYSDALAASQDPRLLSELPKPVQEEWAPYCKANSMLAGARAEYHDAVVHRLAHAWGLEIARLRKCYEKIRACQDFCDSVDHGDDGGASSVVAYYKRECDVIFPVVKDRFEEADKDNYKIYQDEIPKSLPNIKGKQLAKITEVLPETMLQPRIPLFQNV